MIIDNFKDPKYAFMMNNHEVDVEFDGQVYRSVEHAYQAAKTDDVQDRTLIRFSPSARRAKQIGRRIKIRDNWNQDRISVMRTLLLQKFRNSELKAKLLATRNAELLAGGDNYWGQINGQGGNHLGKLLMEIRDQILRDSNEFDESCRNYLTQCCWKRAPEGDGFYGECWTPPWDEDCQYSLLEATTEQRKQTSAAMAPAADQVTTGTVQVTAVIGQTPLTNDDTHNYDDDVDVDDTDFDDLM